MTARTHPQPIASSRALRPASAMSDRRSLLIAWSCLPFLTPAKKRLLLARFCPPETAAQADPREIAEVLSIRPAEAATVKDPLILPRIACIVDSAGEEVVTLADEAYPPLLRTTIDPPLALFTRGATTLLQRPSVAIVGSRRATPYGENVARLLARALSDAGIVVVSGLARGIDGSAHKETLEAGGATVAVLGTGIDLAYPREHRRLRDRIAAEGLVVTEFAPGTPPRRENFPVRNRIIAGLSLGVILVEAGARSGSLITARIAAEEGREVFAVPGPIFSAGSEGTHRLIQDGAKLLHSMDDFYAELPALAPAVPRESSPARSVEMERILGVFSRDEPLELELAASKLGLAVGALSAALLELEMDGALRALPGTRYIRLSD